MKLPVHDLHIHTPPVSISQDSVNMLCDQGLTFIDNQHCSQKLVRKKNQKGISDSL